MNEKQSCCKPNECPANIYPHLKSVCRRTHSGEARMMSGHGLDLARKRELDLRVVELLGGGTTTILGRHFLHLDDLDRGGSGSVPGAHVAVALSHRPGGRQVAVFAVHVVSTGARVVSEPDAEVLDGGWLLLVDLLAGDNLANSLLDLLQTIQVVPEAGLGHNTIGGENAHPVEGRNPQFVGRNLPSDDAVFDQITLCLHFRILRINTYLRKLKYFKQIETTQL